MIKIIPTFFFAITLVACSGPDSSGGVALSKDPYPTNQEFPHGDCDDEPTFGETNTGCGWIRGYDKSYYIKPGADLRGAWFSGDDIVTPTPTDYFRDVKANSSTICPDGTRWGTAGNDCPF